MGVRGLCCCLLLVVMVQLAESRDFQGIPGDYCRNRQPQECCDNREDECAMPIRGTTCYCDMFCHNRTEHSTFENDCCPDFWEVCLGRKPPTPAPGPVPYQSPAPGEDPNAVCDYGGIRIPREGSHTFNCNKCTCTGSAVVCKSDRCMIEADVIREVNADVRRHGWRATNYTQFWGWKAHDGLQLKTGTRIPNIRERMTSLNLRPVGTQIPRYFDARERWDGRVSGVRDQGWCGASWAFSTLAVAQDRWNIKAGITPMTLSAQHLLSCSKHNHDDCQTGGEVDRAWNYLRTRGLATEDCYHYESGTSGKIPRCRRTLSCQGPLYRMGPSYPISSNEEDIQWEIMKDGPVQAVMKVYADLFVYASGIYRHTGLCGDVSSLHSVKIMGWGEGRLDEGIVKYWLVQNSWGVNWGEQGFFKIRRGVDECGIESNVLAARPLTEPPSRTGTKLPIYE